MKRVVCILVIAGWVLLDVSAASAQRRSSYSSSRSSYGWFTHRAEIIPYYGYVWTTGRQFSSPTGPGTVDLQSSDMFGVLVDINVRPGGFFELGYQRQNTGLTFKGGFPPISEKLTDMAVEYYQIGGVGGVKNDNIFGFTKFTLGATRYAPKEPGFSDDWRFSIVLGLGAKMYVNERLALRVEGDMPFTVFSGGAGIGIGPGGGYVSLGGSGIAQWQVFGGVCVLLGS
jgi:hypothetical protein